MCGFALVRQPHLLDTMYRANVNRGSKVLSQTTLRMNDDGGVSMWIPNHSDNIAAPLPWAVPQTSLLIHVQAPTSLGAGRHPAEVQSDLLWHNGILKEGTIARLQKLLGTDEAWDTKLLLMALTRCNTAEAMDLLSSLDGSFACFWYYHECRELYVFRNALAPLYRSCYMDFSSVRIPALVDTPVPANKLFRVTHRNLEQMAGFSTFNNPYDV